MDGHRCSGCSHNLAMACPRCGTYYYCPPRDTSAGAHIAVLIDPDHYDPSEEIFSATLSTPPPTEPAVAVAQADPQFYRATEPEPQWRSEVSSRVSNFRSRRRRPTASAHASMRFDFDTRDAAPVTHAELSTLPRLEPEVAKIIAFPKALPELTAPEELDEAIASEPRIVEAHPEAHTEAHPEEAHPEAHPVAHSETAAEEPLVSEGEMSVQWEHAFEVAPPPAMQAERLADPVVDEFAGQVLEADPELALPMVTPLADIAFDAPTVAASDERTFDLLEEEVALSLAPVFDRTIAGVIDAVVANSATLLFMGVFTFLAKPAMERSSLL